MRELGGTAKEEHEKVVEKIVEGVDNLYCVGPLTREFVLPHIKKLNKRNVVKDVKWFKNATEVGEFLEHNIIPDSIILFKGSQNTIFLEEAIKYILKHPEDSKLLCRQSDFWMKLK